MPADTPWQIDAHAYPHDGTPAAVLRFLAGYAILAPSSHNTQPWRFRLVGNSLELWADRTRRLPVVDPDDRALVISCGAALGALHTALRAYGHAGEIARFPEPEQPDLLARIGLGGDHTPSRNELARFRAIPKRRTTRMRFADSALPDGLPAELIGLAADGGTELACLTAPETREWVSELVAEGDRTQFADPAFRRELAHWVRSRRAGAHDGMSGANFGMPDMLSGVGGLVIRTFDLGGGVAAKDRDIAAHSPALLVFATPGDTPAHWLAAGEAHMAVFLAITAAGLTAAYLNQPVEVPDLRPRLLSAAGLSGVPQLLMRAGEAEAVRPAVRRPLGEVLAMVE